MYLLHICKAFTRKQLVMYAFVISLVTSLTIGTAWGFSVAIHQSMTKDVLKTITAQVAGQPKGFSNHALEEIAGEHWFVDNITPAIAFPVNHFTDESFSASSNRLIDHKTKIISKLTADRPDGTEARKLLGRALHTLQDFYSHSNWVETGHREEINMALGRVLQATQ